MSYLIAHFLSGFLHMSILHFHIVLRQNLISALKIVRDYSKQYLQVVEVLSKHAGLWITRDKEIMYSQVSSRSNKTENFKLRHYDKYMSCVNLKPD